MKPEFAAPVVLVRQTYQTASAEHCHQVKVNDCNFPLKAIN